MVEGKRKKLLRTQEFDNYLAEIWYKEGFRRGLISETIRFSNKRFGELSSTTIRKLEKLSQEKVDELIEVLFDFESKEFLEKWLSTNK